VFTVLNLSAKKKLTKTISHGTMSGKEQEEFMVDKALFMETLRAVQEVAKASQEPMGREEIQEYFKDMELSPQQQEMIYQYFQEPMEKPISEETGRTSQQTKNKKSSGGRKDHTRHYQMYLNEINHISELSREGKEEMYRKLLEGDSSAVSVISTQWLKRITEIAGAYVTGRALVEDLVQEGNMGLLLGMEQLLGAGDQYRELALDSGAMERKLEAYVREAMEQYRQETEGTDHGESSILAKVNLVYEAQKALAEENGTIPGMEELSDYTRIPVDEICDIMALSRKKGEGEKL
jgi:RNA polymerase primary sigma factor